MEYLHTMVRVTDLDQSLDFYCDKFGLVEMSRIVNEKGRFTLVYLAAPGDAEAAKTTKRPLIELTYNWTRKLTQAGAISAIWRSRSMIFMRPAKNCRTRA